MQRGKIGLREVRALRQAGHIWDFRGLGLARAAKPATPFHISSSIALKMDASGG